MFAKNGRGGRFLSLLALALTLPMVAIAAACGGSSEEPKSSPTPAAAQFPLTITDSSGKQITFNQAPKRIVSYSPGATEILFAIGAGPQVVAVDKFSDYPAATAGLPKLEYSRPAPEPALALNPDLVVMATRQEGQVEQFRAAGMTVVLLREPPDLKGVSQHVRLLGQITGHADKGEALAADMDRRIQAVQEKVSKVAKGPLVFWEVTPDGYTVAPSSFLGAMLSLVRAGNVAEGATTPFPQISAETIIKADPEVIILADSGDFGGQSLATVRARPGWSGIKAVVNSRVYEVDPNIFSRPGPRVVEALEQLVKLLYPNLG